MTKQEAEEFFARNPHILELMKGMQEDGMLEKLDSFFPSGQIQNADDARVNCVAAFLALRKPLSGLEIIEGPWADDGEIVTGVIPIPATKD